uniref:F-box domain-containing protein n=1 Tax=Saccharum spontaneum TaxID=62335 RepID=A0A678T4G2_SACSP|nr:hypothetical protein SS81G08_000001 [Saccharum spontaneum]
MAGLPNDILKDLLGRLSPRDQASSRCVCKAWRGVIDARRLLRADLLMDGDYVFLPLFTRGPRLARQSAATTSTTASLPTT